jgi:hypothetical protein
MATPTYNVAADFPYDSLWEPDIVRAYFQLILDANVNVATLAPAGELVGVPLNKKGARPVSEIDAVISGGYRGLRHYKPHPREISVSETVKEAEHLNEVLSTHSGSGCLVTIELSNDPTLGVGHFFTCALYRSPSAGEVQVSSSTLTLFHDEGHTRVKSGGIAFVLVDAIENVLLLKGETQA